MAAEQFNQFISKKAYEISYALLRIASVLPHAGFAKHIEDHGLALLDFSIREDYKKALLASKSLEYFLQLGLDLNIFNAANAEVIIHELRQLNAAIAELQKSPDPLPIDLGGVFSAPPSIREEEKKDIPTKLLPVKEVTFFTDEPALVKANFRETFIGAPASSIPSDSSANNPHVKSAMRQSAILERIRQSGNCRLKDLQDYFKDTSERTIRYDIQSLVEKGLVDRLGNGGPSTYYRARKEA